MNEEGEGEVEWYIELAESIPIPVYIVLVIFFPPVPALPTPALENEHRPERPALLALPTRLNWRRGARARTGDSSYCQS